MTIVKDFYSQVDISSGAWVPVPFGDMQDGQAVLNVSGVDCEVSFDVGAVVTAIPLRASGATSQLVWETHRRASLQVRRSAGSGSGFVEVFTWRELR